MVAVSMLPHAEFGGNDHREDAPYFIKLLKMLYYKVKDAWKSMNSIYNPINGSQSMNPDIFGALNKLKIQY